MCILGYQIQWLLLEMWSTDQRKLLAYKSLKAKNPDPLITPL